VNRAKKAIATFKLRQGMPIGCFRDSAPRRDVGVPGPPHEFALPRVRDFRGVSRRAFDGKGNYALGVREHIIFPEIDYDKTDKIKGLNVCIVTTATSDEESRALLTHLGMPFRKPGAAK
jgi:large subunit ribosomal protein L5